MDQSPEERRDVLFERIEELTGREFPRNQFLSRATSIPTRRTRSPGDCPMSLGRSTAATGGKCSQGCSGNSIRKGR